jgi:hypothetical protein
MSEAVKPKPPSSIRLGEERETRLDAYRQKTGLKFSDAIHKLLDVGLADAGYPNPKAKPPKKDRLRSEAVQKRWEV